MKQYTIYSIRLNITEKKNITICFLSYLMYNIYFTEPFEKLNMLYL